MLQTLINLTNSFSFIVYLAVLNVARSVRIIVTILPNQSYPAHSEETNAMSNPGAKFKFD
jgi:hypothetical protein